MPIQFARVFVCLSAIVVGLQLVHAEDAAISETGTVLIKRRPEIMRVQIELGGKGATIEDAIANLRERRRTAEKTFIELGASKQSIVFHGPRETGTTSQERALDAIVTERLRSTGKGSSRKASEDVVNVVAISRAEWPLKGKSSDELAVEVHNLIKKIRAADIAGTGEAKHLSPAEQEVLEESAPRPGERIQPAPGEPQFAFVINVSASEEKAAMAEAFARAKAEALKVCEALGAQLGALKGVSVTGAPNERADDFFGDRYESSNDQVRRYQESEMMWTALSDSPHEAGGPDPTVVTRLVQVYATFALR